MEIVRIFDINNQGLFSIEYDNEPTNEFDRLFALWNDIKYLEEFFHTHQKDLSNTSFYGPISVEEAISRTMEDRKEFQKRIFDIAKNDPKKPKHLDDYFQPLNNISYKSNDLEEYKAYGTLIDSWIRIYAIKVEANYYVISGGAIKLTKSMKDRAHTQKELEKLTTCRDLLRSLGIYDKEGLKQ